LPRTLSQQFHWTLLKRRLISREGVLAAILFAFLLLGGAGCISQDVETAPAFSLADLGGQEVTLKELSKERDPAVLVSCRGYF
jgi:hypothetical protein